MKKLYITLIVIGIALFGWIIFDTVSAFTNVNTLRLNQQINVESNRVSSEDSYVQNYRNYVESKEQLFPQGYRYTISALDFINVEGDYEILNNYQGVSESLLTYEAGSFTYQVDIEEKGFYHILIKYYTYPGKSSAIERGIKINGETPFTAASQLVFHRYFGSDEVIYQDSLGNDVRPSQVEKPMWSETYVKDSLGYITEPFYFYLEEGLNTIEIESYREPMVVEYILVESIKKTPTYQEIKQIYEQNNYKVANQDLKFIQAETPSYTTSPTLYALNDRTSALTSPSHPSLIKLNTIGGSNWDTAGDFIVWNFEVPETGLYEISLRVKQRLATGMSVFRNIYIDGEIPFEEMRNYPFVQSDDWRIQTLGTNEEAYLFYLEAGTHEIKMEVSLGIYGQLISELQQAIDNLNTIYREIIMYTGPEPDQYRDYALTTRIPNLLKRFEEEREILISIKDALIEISGSRSEKTGILDTAIYLLDFFLEKPREIHKNLSDLVSNISSLGTLVILLSGQPLEIDYFILHQPEAKLPRMSATIFESLWYDFRAFLATFTTDYSQVGKRDTGEVTDTITVWMTQGQDQANILRRLIDESFAPTYGIQVDLKLVTQSSLLPATLSGKGPDVALGLDNATPVNYAMRSAAYPISTLEGFEEVAKRFKSEAFVPFYYDGNYYALPDTQTWLMMFYRTDIFDQLGLTPPNTWEDLVNMIPTLQRYNLEVYLPVPQSVGTTVLAPNPIFSSMFYQANGEFYINDGRESGFNEGLGPEIFKRWSSFYSDYSFPVDANFVNRFRSGQMPIGITYYNAYNTLAVFAPEIRGKWDFMVIPGTEYQDENGDTYIRRDTVATGTSAIILNQSKKVESAWQFLQWWTSTETQVRFGREMESILGSAARYTTANIEALQQLPWTIKELDKLIEQWDWVRGIPEVPGGYMTGRYLDNAFRSVINNSADPKDALYDYVQMINDELSKKRREFGLD